MSPCVSFRAVFTPLLLLMLLSPGIGNAIEQVDLYTVVVDVESEDRSERRSAARQALQTVYVRVSGMQDVLARHASLSSSLSTAHRYLASYSYREVDVRAFPPLFGDSIDTDKSNASKSSTQEGIAGGPGDQLIARKLQLELVFQSQAIDRMLDQHRVQRWQAGRPGLLVWLVFQRDGERELVNLDTVPGLMSPLLSHANARGIPVIQPLLDLEEVASIDVDKFWLFSEQAIEDASQRYDAGAVLVGKVSRGFRGEWMGQWQYSLGAQTEYFRFTGDSEQEFVKSGVDLAANQMAASYAIRTFRGGEGQVYTLVVDGVRTADDYRLVSEYITGIEGLHNTQLTHINRGSLYFNFESSSALSRLAAVLELNRSLQSLPGGTADLNYQWVSNNE